MKPALIIIRHFRSEWNGLAPEQQAGLATRIRRAAERAKVEPVVGYKLDTPGSVMDIWEADDRAGLRRFQQELEGLDYRTYFDVVLMLGERSEAWIRRSEGGK